MYGPDSLDEAAQQRSNLRWRRILFAALCGSALCVVFAARFASGAWSDASLPVGEVIAQDAMINGVVRLHGMDFTLYSGARIRSLGQGLNVHLERGGAIALCPRSELQVISAQERPGILLAFQAGGAQVPFSMRPNDVVMTPDWQISLEGGAEPASLLVSMNPAGDLCFRGQAPQSSYFHVSQTVGDASFDLHGNNAVSFIHGTMQDDHATCGCGPSVAEAPMLEATAASHPATAPMHVPTATSPISPIGAIQTTPAEAVPLSSPSMPARKHHRHPQDLVGYIGATVHFLFGR